MLLRPKVRHFCGWFERYSKITGSEEKKLLRLPSRIAEFIPPARFIRSLLYTISFHSTFKWRFITWNITRNVAKRRLHVADSINIYYTIFIFHYDPTIVSNGNSVNWKTERKEVRDLAVNVVERKMKDVDGKILSDILRRGAFVVRDLEKHARSGH